MDLQELTKKSSEISALCVDEPCQPSHYGEAYHHHLPLKDEADHFLDEDNWALTEEQKNMVHNNLADLTEYAEKILNKYAAKGISLYFYPSNEKEVFDEELLPHWVVFPHYPMGTIGWRMGLGEAYGFLYTRYLGSLSAEEFMAHCKKYPRPKYMKSALELYEERKREIHGSNNDDWNARKREEHSSSRTA